MENKTVNENNIHFEVSLESHLIVTTTYTIHNILKYKNGADALALYNFYCYISKLQKTSTIRANNEFCMKGLSWSKLKLINAKKVLETLNLITVITKRDEKNKITGHYIHIGYILSEKSIKEKLNVGEIVQKIDIPEVSIPDGGKSHPVEISTGRKNHPVENLTTNTYINNSNTNINNINAELNNSNATETTAQKIGYESDESNSHNTINEIMSDDEGESKKQRTPKVIKEACTKTSPAIDKYFDLFWSMYPRKAGDKRKAKEVFYLLNVDEELYNWIISSLSQYKNNDWLAILQDKEKKELKYIPHPLTWLNQRRWENYENPNKKLSPVDEYEIVMIEAKEELRKLAQMFSVSEDKIRHVFTSTDYSSLGTDVIDISRKFDYLRKINTRITALKQDISHEKR